jgi:aminodeoxyfutalosine deaminase
MSKPKLIRCRQIITGIPGQEPIDDGCLIHDGNTILDIGLFKDLIGSYTGKTSDLGEVTIVPGLINAHCHLELSKLEGKTLSGQGFVPWLQSMMKHDYRTIDYDAVKNMVMARKTSATCCYGDILAGQNTKTTDILTELKIYFTCFFEAFGFLSNNRFDTGDMRYQKKRYGYIAGSGHALHTNSASVLQDVKQEDRKHGFPFSIHLAEHDDEAGMLMGEKTAFYNLLEQNKMLGNGFSPPMKTPVAYAHDLGLLDRTTLSVHCVKVSDKDIEILSDTGTNICLCPRSNAFINVGRAPWEKIMDSGINVSLGTDSIASNYDLNLWNELEYFIQRFDRKITISDAIALITCNPAKALLMNDKLGTLEKGKVMRYAIMPEQISALIK